jgi:sec-independent protein translocase protein TatB
MSGVGFSEFLILCLIGLIVLGPKRLPKVANQVGSWVGQARRMTRVMKRQLEEELDFDKDLGLDLNPTIHQTPNDDDTYSPLHSQPSASPKLAGMDLDGEAADCETGTDATEPSADEIAESDALADSSAESEPPEHESQDNERSKDA